MDGIFTPGAVLFDTYRIDDVIKSGGMGIIYRARHLLWDVDLAIKRPRPELFEGESQKAMFAQECEAWIGLGLHLNICSCYYVREIDGVPSVFAEWMEAGSLRDWMASGRLYEGGDQLAAERILDIAIQTCRGLHYAHERGLVHQDVKPENLLLKDDGTAKVSDYGVSRAIEAVTAQTPSSTPGAAAQWCRHTAAARSSTARSSSITTSR
jgi:serine/threonine protein kinase